jgi:hypothetical protein
MLIFYLHFYTSPHFDKCPTHMYLTNWSSSPDNDRLRSKVASNKTHTHKMKVFFDVNLCDSLAHGLWQGWILRFSITFLVSYHLQFFRWKKHNAAWLVRTTEWVVLTCLSETGSDVTCLSTRLGSDRFSIPYARFNTGSFSECTDFGWIIQRQTTEKPVTYKEASH